MACRFHGTRSQDASRKFCAVVQNFTGGEIARPETSAKGLLPEEASWICRDSEHIDHADLQLDLECSTEPPCSYYIAEQGPAQHRCCMLHLLAHVLRSMLVCGTGVLRTHECDQSGHSNTKATEM